MVKIFKKLKKTLIYSSLALLLTTSAASADPVTAVAAITAWIISTFAITSITAAEIIFATVSILLNAVVSIGLSYIEKALAGGQKKQPVGAQELQGSGVVPRSFIFGEFVSAGSLIYANTWGEVDHTPNAFLTMVIALSDLPVNSLQELWVNGEKCTYSTSEIHADWGYRVPEFVGTDGTPYLWAEFHDGTQTSAGWLSSHFNATDFPLRPWPSTSIGYGVSYVTMTARVNNNLFPGFPQLKFVMNGINLYDPREDTTVGGSGSQRINNPSTWTFSKNPMVVLYNILSGLFYNDIWIFGLQNLPQARLPFDAWSAAMNECDVLTLNNEGLYDPQYITGGEVSVNSQAADIIDNILTACNARLAEIGGTYKPVVGAATGSVYGLSDDDLITTEQQTFDQFPSLTNIINTLTAQYPEPTQGWVATDAPQQQDATALASDNTVLSTQVSYAFAPYLEQVERLMLSALAEGRKFRVHTLTLPPEAWVLEPNDIITYTSNRNGYDNKQFRINLLNDNANLDIMAIISEVDPSDYDYDPSSDYIPKTNGPLNVEYPPTQLVDSFTAEGITITGDTGAEAPGIYTTWTSAVDDVTAIHIQVVLASDTSIIVFDQSTPAWYQGTFIVAAGLVPNTAYKVRSIFVVNDGRSVDWTSYVDVTTPDISTTLVNLDGLANVLYYNATTGTATAGQDFQVLVTPDLNAIGYSGYSALVTATSSILRADSHQPFIVVKLWKNQFFSSATVLSKVGVGGAGIAKGTMATNTSIATIDSSSGDGTRIGVSWNSDDADLTVNDVTITLLLIKTS